MENNQEHLIVACPFDPKHRVLQQRLLWHIAKCSKIHTDSQMLLCPYNDTHLFKEDEMEKHISVCKSAIKYRARESVEPVTEEPARPIIDCDSWDTDPPVPIYDPEIYCRNNLIVRNYYGDTHSMRRNYRESDRIRFRELKKNQ